MPATAENIQANDQLNQLSKALESGAFIQVRRMLNSLPAPDVAHVIESSPPKTRAVIWRLIDLEREGEILPYLNDEIESQFLSTLDSEELLTITEGLEADDIADILQQLPDRVTQEVLQLMDKQDRQRVDVGGAAGLEDVLGDR